MPSLHYTTRPCPEAGQSAGRSQAGRRMSLKAEESGQRGECGLKTSRKSEEGGTGEIMVGGCLRENRGSRPSLETGPVPANLRHQSMKFIQEAARLHSQARAPPYSGRWRFLADHQQLLQSRELAKSASCTWSSQHATEMELGGVGWGGCEVVNKLYIVSYYETITHILLCTNSV